MNVADCYRKSYVLGRGLLAFKEHVPEVPLPPEPVVAWTWLRAVKYWHRHFAGVKAVINGLAADDSLAVRKAQTALGSLHISSGND